VPVPIPVAVIVPLLDLAAEHAAYQPELDAAWQQTLHEAAFIQGPAVGEFAAALGTHLGQLGSPESHVENPHLVPCANGTDALLLALLSLELPPGTEVIVPAFTYIAPLEAAALLGLRPVLADVLPDTFNLDPAAVRAALTPRTGAVIAVHLFGQCADLEELTRVCRAAGVALIEDNAQALGATYTFASGRRAAAGTVGEVGTTSFFPSKNLGCLGDGGALFTADPARAERLRQLASHGQSQKYQHQRLGLNSRLDTLQAALLLVKLRHLPAAQARRQAIAARYDAALATAVGVHRPARDPRSSHVFHQYTLTVEASDGRDALQQLLRQYGIASAVYYPLAVHEQPGYTFLNYKPGDFPVAERLSRQLLSLPVHPALTAAQVEHVVEQLVCFNP